MTAVQATLGVETTDQRSRRQARPRAAPNSRHSRFSSCWHLSGALLVRMLASGTALTVTHFADVDLQRS